MSIETEMGMFWIEIIQRQMFAAMDMFGSAIQKCPEELWTESLWQDSSMPAGLSDFWYLAYHTLFWLDLYLTGSIDGFAPPEPFSLEELDPAGLLPERVYTAEELQSYLSHCRQKCRLVMETLTEEKAHRLCRFSWGELPYGELLLDTMRHVQEHGAQLNLFLGQQAGQKARWVARGKEI